MKKVSIAIACSMLLLSMTGCGVDDRAQNNTHDMGAHSMNNGQINTYDNAVNDKRGNQMNGNQMRGNQMDGNQQMGNNHHVRNQSMLSQHLSGIEGVSGSTIFVDDDNIIVGLDVDRNADRAQVEEQVRKMLMKDHNGQNIHITSDAAMNERIRTLNNQVNQLDGKPLKNMANDIRTLIDDIGKSVEKAIR